MRIGGACVASSNFGWGVVVNQISKTGIDPTTIIVRTISQVAVCIFVLRDICI